MTEFHISFSETIAYAPHGTHLRFHNLTKSLRSTKRKAFHHTELQLTHMIKIKAEHAQSQTRIQQFYKLKQYFDNVVFSSFQVPFLGLQRVGIALLCSDQQVHGSVSMLSTLALFRQPSI